MTISLDRPHKSGPSTDQRQADRRQAGSQRVGPLPTAAVRPTTQLRRRDRYIDFLRALALLRVVTYHMFGWAWLPILFPSLGIMFALAGSLVASSLDRSPGNPWRVLKARTIRLLPPVWLLGLILVPAMLVAGWTHSETIGAPLKWQTLLFWIVPISDPPGSELGDDWVSALWYVRAYVWFLLLSPAALWLFRHWPKRMMAIPLFVMVMFALDVWPLEGRSGDVVLSIAMYGGCWMLGFAHHDNKIRPLPIARVLLGGASLMALGLIYAFTHQNPSTAYAVDEIPIANTLYCLGAVLILLRLYPDFSWMDRHVVLDKILTVINSRAMTIYLWGNVAIVLASTLLDQWSVTQDLNQDNAIGYLQMFVATWLIIIGLVFAFGWCEDLAARRPLRLNPWPRSEKQLETMRTRKVLTFPHPSWLPELTPKRLLFITAGLLVAAASFSAAALVGTQTPGRASTGDVLPRSAVNPRSQIVPPVTEGQRDGQKFEVLESIEKIKGVILGEDTGVRPVVNTPTNLNPTQAPKVPKAGVPLLTPTVGATKTQAPAGAVTKPGQTSSQPPPGGAVTQPGTVVPPSPGPVVPSSPAVIVPTPTPTKPAVVVPTPTPTPTKPPVVVPTPTPTPTKPPVVVPTPTPTPTKPPVVVPTPKPTPTPTPTATTPTPTPTPTPAVTVPTPTPPLLTPTPTLMTPTPSLIAPTATLTTPATIAPTSTNPAATVIDRLLGQ